MLQRQAFELRTRVDIQVLQQDVQLMKGRLAAVQDMFGESMRWTAIPGTPT